MSSLSVAKIRQALGMTQREFAELCSRERGSRVYQHQISLWERGAPQSKSTQAMLKRIAKRLPAARAASTPQTNR